MTAQPTDLTNLGSGSNGRRDSRNTTMVVDVRATAISYSSMSNIDIEIGEGNPAAAGVRFRMAQHAFLRHMDFRLGSAFAGVYQAGNIMEDVHFHGGRYGIVTEKTRSKLIG